MKDYTRLYLNAMQYDESDWIPCEVCNDRAVDIHHIKARGMGGTKHEYRIEELMALCRKCHLAYGDNKLHRDLLITHHRMAMESRGIKIENEYE